MSAIHSLEPILAAHPFFDGLAEGYLELLAGCAANMRVDPGHYLTRTGEEANSFFLIREGRVAIEIAAPGRDPITIRTVGEGEILGWSWLIPPFHWHFDAVATERARVVALDAQCLRTKCEADHELGYQLLKRFGQIVERDLQATRMQLLDVFGGPR